MVEPGMQCLEHCESFTSHRFERLPEQKWQTRRTQILGGDGGTRTRQDRLCRPHSLMN